MMSVGTEVFTEVIMKNSISGSKLATCFSLVYFLANSSTLKMGAICAYETSIDFNRTSRVLS
jgi:hypothetical protein